RPRLFTTAYLEFHELAGTSRPLRLFLPLRLDRSQPFYYDYSRGDTMSELSRRGFIGSAAAAASLVGLTAAADEEFSFKNNVPEPVLSGPELPTFKFELEKSKGKVIGRSYGKAVTEEQLPTFNGTAGVPMM